MGNIQTMGTSAQASTRVAVPEAPDLIRPLIRITGPKPSGLYPASGRIRIKGNASDNEDLASWHYKLNRDRWRFGGSLSGRSSSWSRIVGKAVLGKNLVQVRAYDSAGLVSVTSKRTVRLTKSRKRS